MSDGTETAAPAEIEVEAAPAPAEVVEETPTEATETEGEEDASEGEDETSLRDDKGRYKKGSAQDRIGELTRARREAERERDFYKGLVSQPTPTSPVEGAAKPTPDSFDSYDEYTEALTDWKIDQREAKRSTETSQRTEALVQQANWTSKLEAAAVILPDYADVVGSSEVPIAPHVGQALMDSDRGPELAYHMAQNPDVAERLNKLSPIKAAMELGRLETALAAPAAKPTTKAPAPITPIRPASARQADPAKMTTEEYVEFRRKQGAGF